MSVPTLLIKSQPCANETQRDVCNSPVCPGYAWCQICDACVPKDQAVYSKDEL